MQTREAQAGILRGVTVTDSGCPFFDRSPVGIEGLCDRETPPKRRDEHGHGHLIACHREVEELAGEDVVVTA